MSFITGNGFKNLANFIFDENGFRQNRPLNSKLPVFFVKTDYVDIFFNTSNLLPSQQFKLITHNSDHSINYHHLDYINNPNLQVWFAQNVDYEHPKLIPIPIGIANQEWPHGDISLLQKAVDQNYDKQQTMYANFNIATNPKQRRYCLKYIPSQFIENNVDFYTYLKHTAQAYFSICPLGNGIDSHRIWESLYLKTIPVVENLYNIRKLKKIWKLPIILIDDWQHLNSLQLNKNTYDSIIQPLQNYKIRMEQFHGTFL